MNLKQVYQAVLIELEKQKAPSMLLDEFNYYYYKSVIQYINTKYNFCDMNQQEDDDLRVLNMTATLSGGNIVSKDDDKTLFTLPSDYFHLKNCVITFNNPNAKCNSNSIIKKGARRLTSDKYPGILNNYYFKPSFKRPYYYIHNVNINVDNPTNPYSENNISGTDIKEISDSGLVISERPRSIKIGNKSTSLVKRQGEIRYGNVSPIRMEIRYGSDNSKFELVNVYVEYLKVPQQVILTKEQLDLTEDTSQVMEFPDYVCLEIINELTHIIMENSSDPRLSTHIPISVSIADPAQAVGKK